MICVVANLVLNLALMWWLKHVGLALATALSAWLNTWLLARTLSRRGDFVTDARLRQRLPRTLLAMAIMVVGLAVAHDGLDDWLSSTFLLRILCVVLLVLGGLGLFALSAYVTGAARPDDLRSFRPASNG